MYKYEYSQPPPTPCTLGICAHLLGCSLYAEGMRHPEWNIFTYIMLRAVSMWLNFKERRDCGMFPNASLTYPTNATTMCVGTLVIGTNIYFIYSYNGSGGRSSSSSMSAHCNGAGVVSSFHA